MSENNIFISKKDKIGYTVTPYLISSKQKKRKF